MRKLHVYTICKFVETTLSFTNSSHKTDKNDGLDLEILGST